MGEPLTVLERYVPAMVRRRLVEGGGASAWMERLDGAVLFADVAGSTALAERLAERGPRGAEEFGRVLNAFFAPLIEAVHAHGGDVVKFAGDGLYAFWDAAGAGGLDAAVRQAVAGGLAAGAALERAATGDEARLSVRMGIGAGGCGALAVGEDGRFEFLLVGAATVQACAAQQVARPGDLVASPDAWALLAASAAGDVLDGGAVRIRGLRADERPGRPAAAAAAAVPASAADLAAALRCFAPPPALARLAAGHDDWLAELRRITALFVQLPDWSTVGLEEARATLAAIHTVLDRYEGHVIRLGMDARGPVAKAAFGLPPRAHEDDAVRGVQAALDVCAELERRGARVAIGIASGRAFCGEVGDDRRREYTTVGETVHRAARLMQSAGAGVLCDAATRAACGERIDFSALVELRLKGIAEPVAAFRPRGRARGVAPSTRTLVGRAAERERLLACVDRAAGRVGSSIVVLEGEAGIGKSRLVGEVLAGAAASGVLSLVGTGDAIESNTPYHAWRPILARLVAGGDVPVEGVPTLAVVRAALARLGDDRLAGVPVASLAPLLLPVLGADAADDEVTARITGEARVDVTHALVVRLLQREASAQPVLVVIEDAHWVDSASWAIFELMAARVQPLQAIVATRPAQESSPSALRRLLNADGVEVVRLGLLGPEESARLVADRLGVRTVAAPILSFVLARAGGHPFFVEELAAALRETGVLHVSGGECRLSPEAGDLGALDLPQTVEGTLTSRMDLLEARQQLVLKVASVVGLSFSAGVLRDLYPVAADRRHLDGDLAHLEERDLIRRRDDDTYAFKHAITRDVAYERLAFAQRRQLHRDAAEWYERTHRGDLRALDPLLAHHWSRAVDPQRPEPAVCAHAVDLLERAGEQAIESYANGEAVKLFGEALKMESLLGAGEWRRRRARWRRHLADANNRLGRIPEAIDNALGALVDLDRPFPSDKLRRYTGILGQLARQLRHRLLGATARGLDGAARDEALEAAHLYEILGLMWYVTLDGVPATLANLLAVNLAERAGPSPELATSSAMIALSAGVLLGPKRSEHYFRLGLEAARAAGDRYGHGRLCYTRALVHTGDARWPQVEADHAEALSTFEEIGDARWRDIVRIQLASTAFLRSRYGEARRLYEAAAASPRERGDVQAQAWVSVGLAICLAVEGRMVESLEASDRLASWLANNFAHLADRGSELVILGARAVAFHRLGRIDSALDTVEVSLRLVRESPPLTCYVLPAYTQTAEVCLRLWERGDVDPARIERLSAEAVANLARYARLYRLGRPAADLWSGNLAWLRGRRRRALASWTRSLELARRLGLAREEGLAHYELGRRSADGREHLERAREIFRSLELPLEKADVEGAAAITPRAGVASSAA